MTVNKLYKAYIKNNLTDILDDEKIIERLVIKYEVKTDITKENDTSRVNIILKKLIIKKIKSLAICISNDEKISKEICNEISLKVESGDILSSHVFIILIKQLQLEKRLNKEDLITHIEVLSNLFANIGNTYFFENKELTWKELFEYASDLYAVSAPLYHQKLDYDTSDLIKAAKYLKKININYEIIAGRIILSDISHNQIHVKLEGLVKSLGGFTTLNRLFYEDLQPRYVKKMDRYLIHRNKTTLGKASDRVPYNYLINICGKFLSKGVFTLTQIGKESIYSEIVNISKNYLIILQLQSTSIYEDLLVTYRKIPEYIHKNMIFENLYIPNQYKPGFVLNILDNIFKSFYEELNCKEFTFNDYYQIANVILNEYSYCSTINFEDLRVKLGMNRQILINILNVIAVDNSYVNESYSKILTPTNLFDKPLIKLSEDTYFIIAPHFSGYSFCTVIYQILRSANCLQLNRRLGEAIEQFVKDSLSAKRIPYKSGHYAITEPDKKGECDVILETEEKIIFLEIKKRSLPDTFELGDDVEVMCSLGDGMLNAQKQILRHRIYLQQNVSMKLFREQSEESPYTVVESKERQVVSVSLCFSEYGFLTNKIISAQLLESLSIATYQATDSSKEESLDRLNKLTNKIVQLIPELNVVDKKNGHTIFFNTVFRSLQQFLYVLEVSSNVDELVEYLTREVHLIDGSLDFYSSLYSAHFKK